MQGIRHHILYILIILLIGVLSFGLGRLSKISEAQPDLIIDLLANITAPSTSAIENKYVASKNGTKYHYTWCPGAKQIVENNKIFFSSAEEAKRAGYTPAGNCPGIK